MPTHKEYLTAMAPNYDSPEAAWAVKAYDAIRPLIDADCAAWRQLADEAKPYVEESWTAAGWVEDDAKQSAWLAKHAEMSRR